MSSVERRGRCFQRPVPQCLTSSVRHSNAKMHIRIKKQLEEYRRRWKLNIPNALHTYLGWYDMNVTQFECEGITSLEESSSPANCTQGSKSSCGPEECCTDAMNLCDMHRDTVHASGVLTPPQAFAFIFPPSAPSYTPSRQPSLTECPPSSAH